MLQSWNMKYQFKYNLNISCERLVTINQHKFIVSFFCSFFCKIKLVVNVHEKVHPLSFFIPIFIHKYYSYVLRGRIFFHVTIYYILGVTKYSLNIMSTLEGYSKKDLVLLPYSCSLAHVRVPLFMFMLPCSCSLACVHAPMLTK